MEKVHINVVATYDMLIKEGEGLISDEGGVKTGTKEEYLHVEMGASHSK